jgi:hypothetical protein
LWEIDGYVENKQGIELFITDSDPFTVVGIASSWVLIGGIRVRGAFFSR